MEIEQLKLRLIQLILEIENQEVLLKVLEILQNFEVKTDSLEGEQEYENLLAELLILRQKGLEKYPESRIPAEEHDQMIAQKYGWYEEERV